MAVGLDVAVGREVVVGRELVLGRTVVFGLAAGFGLTCEGLLTGRIGFEAGFPAEGLLRPALRAGGGLFFCPLSLWASAIGISNPKKARAVMRILNLDTAYLQFSGREAGMKRTIYTYTLAQMPEWAKDQKKAVTDCGALFYRGVWNPAWPVCADLPGFVGECFERDR